MINTPVIETVIAFLKSKEWVLSEVTVSHFIFSPPAEIKFDEPFNFKIPRTADGSDYKEYMFNLVFSIASIYEIDKWELLGLVSQTFPEIQHNLNYQKKDIEMKQMILKFAS